MPFIKLWRRERIKEEGQFDEAEAGDLCYVHYKKMVEKWKANPRWMTAHEIYKEWFWDYEQHIDMNGDDITAARLAWQVFFNIHVMPYELKKRAENGDI